MARSREILRKQDMHRKVYLAFRFRRLAVESSASRHSSPPLHIRAQGIIEPAQTSLKWYKWSTGWGHFGSDMTLCFAHTLLNIS